MKKLLLLLLAAVMLLSLCACGGQTGPAVPQESTDGTAEQTDPVEAQPTESQKTAFELAEACIEQPVEVLFRQIGQPDSADYAPSCLNPGVGEDGNLYYDGFVVYTYREGTTETVEYVERTE